MQLYFLHLIHEFLLRGEMGALRASLGQAFDSGDVLEGLQKGDGATPGTAKYVKRVAEECSNILQGMLA